MKATQRLHELGQSLWLDNITCCILNDGLNDAALAAQLRRAGAESFDKSWTDLLDRLAAKRAALATGAHIGAHEA